jgi:hypothetical protein
VEIQEECLRDKGAPKQKQEELKYMILFGFFWMNKVFMNV